jgi:hypothetical protein
LLFGCKNVIKISAYFDSYYHYCVGIGTGKLESRYVIFGIELYEEKHDTP